MGNCAILFNLASDSEAQTLSRRIKPSEDQYEDQQERWNALAEYLIEALKVASSYSISTWLQGSYKFGTQIRPPRSSAEFDIDLGVYFSWSGSNDDGIYGPKELKEMVQASLNAYDADDVIEVVSPPKARCSRIRFKGDFHIDIPVYHLDASKDYRALATEDNIWENSDPKALYLWFKDLFDEDLRAKTRRQIRYLKCWAGLKFKNETGRPSSTLITVLVANAVSSIQSSALDNDDDGLYAILKRIVEMLVEDSTVLNPVDNGEVLSGRLTVSQMNAFIELLKALRDLAHEALTAENQIEACDKWTVAFEHFFPLPDTNITKSADSVSANLPAVVVTPEIEVWATAQDNPNMTWSGRNQISGIPKNCDIYFRIVNTSVIPYGSEINWMVRNQGGEAENINDLGHIAGTGLNAKERSAYVGTHFMDCLVKQYGRVIGLRRVPVTITGKQVPRRNPLKKPSWVKLRGSR